MRSIKIDRKKWLTGSNNNGLSVLWCSSEKKGCCLGHAIHQIAKKPWHILDDKHGPEDIFEQQDILGLVKKFVNSYGTLYIRSDFTERAISINDNIDISDKTREKRLIKLFRKNKIRLSFYD